MTNGVWFGITDEDMEQLGEKLTQAEFDTVWCHLGIVVRAVVKVRHEARERAKAEASR